jgi:predicted nuclease with TOPRIM domain
LKNIQTKLDEKKKESKEVFDAIKNRDKLAAEIVQLSKDIENKKQEISNLDSQIKDKKAELEKLTSGVQEKKEEPRVFSAGQYVVGTDLPAGRYKAVPIGEGSNFIVYDSNEVPKVNTILGQFGEPEYIFLTEDGDIIETHSKVKLIE